MQNPWMDNHEYPTEDWQAEVAANDTRLGYLEWIEHQIESNRNDINFNTKGCYNCTHYPKNWSQDPCYQCLVNRKAMGKYSLHQKGVPLCRPIKKLRSQKSPPTL